MKIPKETMDRWKEFKMKGDADRIVASMGDEIRVHSEVIRVGMRTGEFKNLDVFKAVCAFYNAREIEVQEALGGATSRPNNLGVELADVVRTGTSKTSKPALTNGTTKGSTTFLEKRRNQKNNVK